jgi:type II secretory pathway predicted ATPase ExeA
MVSEVLSHLHPAARVVLDHSEAERTAWLQRERWVGYPRAQQALSLLEDLLSLPVRQRMPNLLIIGPTNNGKTMIVEKFCRDHPAGPSADDEHEVIPVVIVQMPSEPDLKRFYAAIVRAVHAPPRPPREVLAKVEDFTLRLLQRIGVRLLIIDEVHNLLGGSSAQQRAFLNVLRSLGNTLRIPLVCVGTREAYLAIRSDEQLENRFAPFALPRWQADADYASLLASFEAIFPLRYPSGLSQPPLSTQILAQSEGTIGEIATFLTRAAILAIRSGQERIDQPLLSQVDYRPPSERRRLFERTLA